MTHTDTPARTEMGAVRHAREAEAAAIDAAHEAREAENWQNQTALARLTGRPHAIAAARTRARAAADEAAEAAARARSLAQQSASLVVTSGHPGADPILVVLGRQTRRAAERAAAAASDAGAMAERAQRAADLADEDADAESDLGEV